MQMGARPPLVIHHTGVDLRRLTIWPMNIMMKSSSKAYTTHGILFSETLARACRAKQLTSSLD
jgi:hypothetical protein